MKYNILSKFIKDISFEIPSAEAFVMIGKEISKYNLNFDIKSNQFKNNIVEVNTILRISPNIDVKHKILTEINLTALVSIENPSGDKKELEKIVLIKVPNEVYPTLYQTFVFLFKQAGLPGLSIEKKVDFEKLYREKKKI